MFNADFEILGDGAFASEKIQFSSLCTTGNLIDSVDLQIDGAVNKSDLALSDYYVSNLVKISWEVNSNFYIGESFVHTFDKSGIQQVKVTAYSEYFEYNGVSFRFMISKSKDVTVYSKFYKMLTSNYPMWETVNNPQLSDLFFACSQFFERMYEDIKKLYTNIDAKSVDPAYFQYFALTLGHDSDYTRKIGADVNNEDFFNYDIYEKIRTGTATEEQIASFRRFLLLSADIFKKKGTITGLTNFLSYFNIDATISELWTKDFGTKSIGITDDIFAGYTNFSDNKLGLNWLNVVAIGNNNDLGHFTNNFNSFGIDNYHVIQKVENPNQVVNTVTSGPKEGWLEFEIDQNLIQDIVYENGNYLPQNEFVYDIVPNNPVRLTNSIPYILQLHPDILDYGDRASIQYFNSQANKTDSLVASSKKVLDCEITATFEFADIDIAYKNNNILLPEDGVFVVLRGVPSDDNLYANFNQYYRIAINGKRSSFSVEKVIQSASNNSLITQKINLTGDKNNIVWDMLLLDGNNEPYQFKKDALYDIKVSLIGNLLSCSFREKVTQNINQEKIENNEGDIQYGKESQDTWYNVISALNLDVNDFNVLSTDQNGEVVISETYSYLSSPGYYGVGVRCSIAKFTEIILNNFDLDNDLYNNNEKEFIKPKFLENQNRNLIQYNSYNDNINNFSNIIEKPFNSNTKVYTLNKSSSDSLQFLYFDNATVSEQIASRYTVIFDKEWVKANFKNEEEVLKKIILPMGKQKSWFIPESRVYATNFYKNYFGGTNDTLTLPDGSSTIIPGFFHYNNSTPTDTYKLEPYDNFSSVIRSDNNFGKELTISDRVQQYLLSNNTYTYKGVWEECSPYSTIFNGIDPELTLDDLTIYHNKVFLPIVVDNGTFKRIVGVRFKNCSDINTLITRGTFGLNDEVQIFGKFTLQYPRESVAFRPDRDTLTQASDSNHYLVDIFVPLGILKPEIQNYALGTEFLHQVENSGITKITMNGVYFRIPATNTTFKKPVITLQDTNPFENREKGMYCRHFLSAELVLATNLEDFEKTFVTNDISNKYMINYNARQMFKSLETSTYDNYAWWLPTEIWRKRDFGISEINVNNDITTGLNFKTNTVPKGFYGHQFTIEDNPKFLQLKILDGGINPNTMYYAKVTLRMNFSGFSEKFLTRYTNTSSNQENRPLTEEESDKIAVVGGNKDTYNDFRQTVVGECLTFYIPISWYPTNEVPSNNVIEWGNYIRGNYGDEASPTITLNPYGLMSWMIMRSGEPNYVETLQNFQQATSGWTLKDWNDRFLNMVNIEYISEKVPSSAYTLYDQLGFVSKYAPNNGSYIQVTYDAGDLDWKVYEQSNLIPKGSSSYYFNIPKEVYPLDRWVNNVKSLQVYNYILPQDLYSFTSPTQIQLNDDVLFSTFNGSVFQGRYFFDTFFNTTLYKTYRDDFNAQRDIIYSLYDHTNNNKFELSTRSANSDFVCGSIIPTYDIISIQGNKCLRVNDDATIQKFDPKEVGVNNIVNNVVKRDENGGYPQKVYMFNQKNQIFDIQADVYFDESLNSIKDYNGKKFDLILKCDTFLNSNTNKYNLSDYYFVGVGAFGFDLALGLSHYDPASDTVINSFLTGFGDYNIKGIKTNTWYTIRAIVTNTYIKVMFNEKFDKPRQVMTYSIQKSRQNDPNRYLSGEFEEMVYLVSGLSKLDITYPDKLGDKTSSNFVTNNFNEDLVKNIRPSGLMSGIRVFNDKTYVTNITYKSNIQNDKIYGGAFEVTDFTNTLNVIYRNFNPTGELLYIGKTLNNTLIVQIGNFLFYKKPNQDVLLWSKEVQSIIVHKDIIIIQYISTNITKMTILNDRFDNNKNVFVKDSSLNTDHIHKYLLYTNRDIDKLFVDKDNLHIMFRNIGQ